jgi:Flp pilus assembly protein TadD
MATARFIDTTQTPSAVADQPTSKATSDLLRKTRVLLDQGLALKALTMVRESESHEIALCNAEGVCLLRLGRVPEALELFRSLALNESSLLLKPDIPTEVKTNFAMALLLDGEIFGAADVLHECEDPCHPSVAKLIATIARWKESLTPLQRLLWHLGSQIEKPIELQEPPGDF